MKQGKYTEEQIVRILKEADAGIKVTDLCRKYGFSDATYYNWKAKYGELPSAQSHLEADCPLTPALSREGRGCW